MTSHKFIFFLLFLMLNSSITYTQLSWTKSVDNPIELGDVLWHRNYQQAVEIARKVDKPIFLLFQEVPGCSTCTSYGKQILSHPLLVEAIETHFVPLCIYNNKEGHDAAILKKFKEPSWNNPVVRLISSDGKDIVPRLASRYSLGFVISGMIEGLRNYGKPIPEYLQLLEKEYLNPQKKEMIFSMYCFWTGEKLMATIPGVTESEAGYMNGREVVKISYDPEVVSEEYLIQSAKKGQCADEVYSHTLKTDLVPVKPKGKFRKDKESKYYLYHSPYRSLPMTQMQQLLANAELGRNGDISYLLSERQLHLKEFIERNNVYYNAIGEDIMSSWKEVIEKLKI